MTFSETRVHRANAAVTNAVRRADEEAAAEARRDRVFERVGLFAQSAAAESPLPLTSEQVAEISAVLAPEPTPTHARSYQ